MKTWIVALVLALLASTAYADLRDQVKIQSVQAIQQKALGNRVVYSVKVDIQNTGERGNIFVNVVALDANGFQIALVPMYGQFETDEIKALTAQTLVDPQNGAIASWQAKSFGKSPIQ